MPLNVPAPSSPPPPLQVQAFQPLPSSSLPPAPSTPSSPAPAPKPRPIDPALDLFLLPGGLSLTSPPPRSRGTSSANHPLPTQGQGPISSPPRAPPRRRLSRIRSIEALDTYGLGGLLRDRDEEEEDDDEEEQEEGEEGEEAEAPSEVVWEGTVESGSSEALERVSLDRSLYIRIRLLPGKGPWSPPLRLPAAAHLDRGLFHDPPDPVLFASAAAGAGPGELADIKLGKRWKLRGTRRLCVFADTWVINKTGLALAYWPTPADPPPAPLPPSPSPADLVLSDRDQAHRFGLGTRLPLLLSCPSHTLRILPYALSPAAATSGLYLSELAVRPSSGCPRVNPCFALSSRPFADCSLTITSLPPPLLPDAAPQRLAILTPPPPPSHTEQLGLRFRVSEGALVHVCLDERLAQGERRPPWLASQGFRASPDCPLLTTSDPALSFVLFSRFYSGGSVVELGLSAAQLAAAAGVSGGGEGKGGGGPLTMSGMSGEARKLLRAASSRDEGNAQAGGGGRASRAASSASSGGGQGGVGAGEVWPFFVVVTTPGPAHATATGGTSHNPSVCV